MEGLDLQWGFAPEQIASDVGVKELTFDGLLPKPLKVEEDGGATSCGGKLWPAGELLSRYLIRKSLSGYKKVLELGSGTGLAGLAMAVGSPDAKDTQIFITDQENMIPLMKANVKINELENRVFPRVLNWGEELPEYCQDVDLVLAADCVYLEDAFPLLKKTLLDLTEEKQIPILVAYKKRRKADRKFFQSLKSEFEIEQITDFPEYESFHRDNVSLMSFKRTKKNIVANA